ncbi:hypothetical protein BJ684DRAFT_22022 [Piptocephalis cylindrospora]|uniref:Myb-like domain-containing protein n=1 Tax=Piptocephalis cylindrospora TaxID=1907219 RepID=A0A4P9XYC5_9FUNG|nr:hypothetical protein BJ684DRAFT_22022 [Piptocephalis cylindrospora]|eukprot:RKP11415.1 hypothetical protein BJ684DRAFT_22022 [Piptocephalis cylindrospora]
MAEEASIERSPRKSPWSAEEDAALREAVYRFGVDWAEVVKYVQERVPVAPKKNGEWRPRRDFRTMRQYQDRAVELKCDTRLRERWTLFEDLRLIFHLVQNRADWEAVSVVIGKTRSKRQCYGRALWLLTMEEYVDVSKYNRDSLEEVIRLVKPQFMTAKSLSDKQRKTEGRVRGV